MFLYLGSSKVTVLMLSKFRTTFHRHLSSRADSGIELLVSRCGLVVRRYAGKQEGLGSVCFGTPFSSKCVVYGHCIVTLPTELMKH